MWSPRRRVDFGAVPLALLLILLLWGCNAVARRDAPFVDPYDDHAARSVDRAPS